MTPPSIPLTFGKAHGTPAPVSTQTVLVRFGSRVVTADKARSGNIPGVLFYGRVRRGLRPAGTAVSTGLPTGVTRPPIWKLWVGSKQRTLTMSDKASGDATPRATFDPSTEIGYYLSQDSHLDLQQLVSAIYATGVMATTPTGEVGADIELHQLAPLFFTLARAGERIIEDLVDSFPTRPSSLRAAERVAA